MELDSIKYGTRHHNKQMMAAMVDFLSANSEYAFFITANFNRDTNYTAARKAIKGWHARIDKKLLGGRWSKKPNNERTQFVAFVEHEDSNLHLHLMVRLGDGTRPWKFQLMASECWRKLIGSGTMDVRKINSPTDRERIANYITKELPQNRAIEHFILSNEFTTKPK